MNTTTPMALNIHFKLLLSLIRSKMRDHIPPMKEISRHRNIGYDICIKIRMRKI